MKNNKYFITGGTGFVGSFIVKHLLEQGHTVICLVRDSNELSGKQRLIEILNRIPSEKGIDVKSLDVICGDIRYDYLGIKDSMKLQGVKYLIHAAASVDFNNDKPDELYNLNISGALRAISMAYYCSIPNFCYISTAYVSGKSQGEIMEHPLDCERQYNNYYEKSKAMAELALSRYASRHEIHLSIIRPGIVVGDSINGYTPSLMNIYSFIYPILKMKNYAESRLSETSAIEDIYSTRICIAANEDTSLNIIPVDIVADATVKVIQREKKGINYFHLLDPSPMKMKEIVRYVIELTGFKGIELISPDIYSPMIKTGINRLLEKQNRLYLGYTTSVASYSTENLRDILPVIDKRALIYRMTEFINERIHSKSEVVNTDSYRDIIHYFDSYLKAKEGRKLVNDLGDFSSNFAIDFRDIPVKPWMIQIEHGILHSVSRDDGYIHTDCIYKVSSGIFRKLINSALTPQDGFFSGEVDIEGDIKHGLQLASLMEIFFKENTYYGSDNRIAGKESAECSSSLN
ncbi:MAG: SDR family oxidoreductase [Nitrospira sp.]|nr:SDR family oxidoreductase [bacterium]MBL7049132.1 SDR family oxidoreductase [Nitrospira sp.]